MSDLSIRPLPADLLSAEVSGRNLEPGALADQLAQGPTLVVFLRHFG